MNMLSLSVLLEHQDAWPFRVVWVILNDRTIPDCGYGVPHQQSVSCQLIVTVIGYSDFPSLDQPKDLLEGTTHRFLPMVYQLS